MIAESRMTGSVDTAQPRAIPGMTVLTLAMQRVHDQLLALLFHEKLKNDRKHLGLLSQMTGVCLIVCWIHLYGNIHDLAHLWTFFL